MCGINGFNFRDARVLTKMNSSITHRGPDDTGTFNSSDLSLGSVRLAIIDLSPAGHMPMSYKRGKNEYMITFNGEIYNYRDLKKDLIVKGYSFNSDSDTEVVMAAYDYWGEDFTSHFNGMWAFCLYDKTNNKMVLSRDRFGIKPLYYYCKDGKFIFSSEIKALFHHSSIKKELDKRSFEEFFTYRFTLDEKTMFKEILNFKPSHTMVFDLKKNKVESYKPYYSVDTLPHYDKKLSFSNAKKKLYDLMESAVTRRLVSDVPVATLLSGGVDSSVVTYLASKHVKKLNTFSIGFDTTNELSYAKLVAEHLGTNHKEFTISEDNVVEHIKDIVYHMDEPIGADPGFFPIYILSKEVKKHNKVVLSGDGADEVFLGYDRYKLFYYGRFLSKFSVVPSKNEVIKRLRAMKDKSDFEAFIEITRVFERDELKRLGVKERFNKTIWNKIQVKGITQAQIFDIKTLLPKDFFMKSDKMSSAHGLEQRVPFMDYRVVDFGLSLPVSYKLKGWNEKYILKKTFEKYLPKKITSRRKHGFNVPIDYWFETSLGDLLKDLLDKQSHNLYKKEYIYELLDDLRTNKTGFKSRNIIAQKLWSVLIFELWYERFMEDGK